MHKHGVSRELEREGENETKRDAECRMPNAATAMDQLRHLGTSADEKTERKNVLRARANCRRLAVISMMLATRTMRTSDRQKQGATRLARLQYEYMILVYYSFYSFFYSSSPLSLRLSPVLAIVWTPVGLNQELQPAFGASFADTYTYRGMRTTYFEWKTVPTNLDDSSAGKGAP